MLNDSVWKLVNAHTVNTGDIIVDDFASHYVSSVVSDPYEILFLFPNDGIKRCRRQDLIRVIPENIIKDYITPKNV